MSSQEDTTEHIGREDPNDDGAGEDLDPRVEGTLGRLNTATDDINRSEKDLDAAKKAFKKGMAQIQLDLAAMLSKCGKKAVEKARPYHDALFKARKAHFEARRAAHMYEQASEKQKTSKELVAKFEKRLMKGGNFDPDLQRKLNNATHNVMEADKRKRMAAEIHSKTTQGFLEADEMLMTLAKSRKKVILKTQPYFACKDQHDRALMTLKKNLQKHEAEVADAKSRVAGALADLERISEEIHQSREERSKATGGTSALAEAKQSTEIAAKIAEAKGDAARRAQEEAERVAQEEEEEARVAAEAEGLANTTIDEEEEDEEEDDGDDDGVAMGGPATADMVAADLQQVMQTPSDELELDGGDTTVAPGRDTSTESGGGAAEDTENIKADAPAAPVVSTDDQPVNEVDGATSP
eukprot:m.844903 g.844903  ORF g.844903 m.844903 type:complete len:410 (-) comp23476_c0_seq4:2140-3369(-)